MPRTTFQRVIYTVLGVTITGFFMSIYNKAWVQGGLSFDVFENFWANFALQAPFGFLLQFCFVQKVAGKQAAKYPTDNQILYRIIRTGFTVMMMCPLFSTYNTFIHAFRYGWGFEKIVCNIFTKIVQNFPFAFCLQIFVAGPIHRFIFSKLFPQKKKSAANKA